MDKHEQKCRSPTDEAKMIIQIRCYSCGKPVAHLWEDYQKRIAKGEDRKKVLDSLGLKRYCCRQTIMGHVDLLETAGNFRKA
jgi:DNA-directed RNA polymerase subunit N